jgi:predicted DNA-binding transcriptional regulator AlpA
MTVYGVISTDRTDDMLFNGDEYLSASSVSARLGLSRRTLERWRDRGGGPPYVRFGGRVFYRTSDVEGWLSARTYGRRSEEAVV